MVGQSRDVAAGPRQAIDQPSANRVPGCCHDDWGYRSHFFSRQSFGSTAGDNDIHFEVDQLGGKIGKAIVFTLCISVLNDYVLSLDPSALAQSLLERPMPRHGIGSREWRKNAYPGDLFRLLRLSGKAKRKEHGAKRKDSDFSLHVFPCSLHSTLLTRPSFHLMTLSALASTFGGIVRPICFAAFKLITNSNFVGCSTGRSAGFAPFKILSTYVAARRNKSVMLGP